MYRTQICYEIKTLWESTGKKSRFLKRGAETSAEIFVIPYTIVCLQKWVQSDASATIRLYSRRSKQGVVKIILSQLFSEKIWYQTVWLK
jgi:hypothetical protein